MLKINTPLDILS